MSNEKQLKKTYWDYKSEIFIYLACCASLFHLYNLGISMMNMWQYRLLHVCFAAILVFFSQPLLKKEKHKVLDECPVFSMALQSFRKAGESRRKPYNP